MSNCSFILTAENREKLSKEGLSIEPRLVDKELFFEDDVQFYNCSTNSQTLYNMGGFSFSRSVHDLLRIGNYCSIDGGVKLMRDNHPYERFTVNTITYHKYASVSFGSMFIAGGLEETIKIGLVPNPDKHLFRVRSKKFRIGSEVWIRGDCLLANNIQLSTGCCVEQNSVVVKDVPPYAIVSGNPAKIIGYRFSEKIIEQLLETRWSEYDITPMEMKSDIPIEQFIDLFYDYKDKGKIKPIIMKKLKTTLDKLEISYDVS